MNGIFELNHEQKVELLKAVQCGTLDLSKLNIHDPDEDLTDEEIKNEMERLYKLDTDFETCRMLQKIGLCQKNCNK